MQNSFRTPSSVEKKERNGLNRIMIKTILEDPNKTWSPKMKEVEKFSKIEKLAKNKNTRGI